MNTIYMTESGLAQAKNNLARKLAEYDEICKERATAHALSGDGWHDNPHFNRMQQLEVKKSRDIAALKGAIERARIITIDPKNRPTAQVGIGSVVQLRIIDLSTDRERNVTWEIVGYDETDVRLNKLAYNTPMAAAVMGLEVGEEVEATLPNGNILIEITDILNEA